MPALISGGELMALGAHFAKIEANWRPDPQPSSDAPLEEVLRWALRNVRGGNPGAPRSLEYYATVGIDYFNHDIDFYDEIVRRLASAIEAATAGETVKLGSTEGESAVGATSAETPAPGSPRRG